MRFLAVAVAVSAAVAPVASAASPDAIDRARDTVLGDDYQADLPRGGDSPDRASAGGEHRDLGGGSRRLIPVDGEHADRARDEGGGLAPSGLIAYLVWALAIAGGGVLAFWLGRELAGYTGDATAADEDDRGGAAPLDLGIVARPLGDADELARRGLYAEAIHTLLLRTLQELARSASIQLGASHTSREILARVPLIGDARDALSGLVIAVEVTHFGDGVPDADDYARCRRQFHVFAAAFRAGPGLAA